MVETRRDSFYIYMNSSFNINEYPENQATSFTNLLKPTLTHACDYEVGLVNIIFQPDYRIIEKNDNKFSINFQFSGETKAGYPFTFSVYYTPQTDISAPDIETLIKHVNSDIYSFLIDERVELDVEYKNIFTYDQYKPRVVFNKIVLDVEYYNSYTVKWNVSSSMCKILGIDDIYNSFENSPLQLSKPEFPKAIPERLLIYSDIVETTNYGGSSVNLLDVIPAKPGIYSKNSTFPVYKRVNMRSVDAVSIVIRNEKGEEVPFVDSTNITIVLHFKRMI